MFDAIVGGCFRMAFYTQMFEGIKANLFNAPRI